MSDILLECTNCHQSLAAPEEMQGETTSCPKCQATIQVPMRLKPQKSAYQVPPPIYAEMRDPLQTDDRRNLEVIPPLKQRSHEQPRESVPIFPKLFTRIRRRIWLGEVGSWLAASFGVCWFIYLFWFRGLTSTLLQRVIFPLIVLLVCVLRALEMRTRIRAVSKLKSLPEAVIQDVLKLLRAGQQADAVKLICIAPSWKFGEAKYLVEAILGVFPRCRMCDEGYARLFSRKKCSSCGGTGRDFAILSPPAPRSAQSLEEVW